MSQLVYSLISRLGMFSLPCQPETLSLCLPAAQSPCQQHNSPATYLPYHPASVYKLPSILVLFTHCRSSSGFPLLSLHTPLPHSLSSPLPTSSPLIPPLLSCDHLLTPTLPMNPYPNFFPLSPTLPPEPFFPLLLGFIFPPSLPSC